MAQPSLGAPPPGVSGGGAPDQRTARLWREEGDGEGGAQGGAAGGGAGG